MAIVVTWQPFRSALLQRVGEHLQPLGFRYRSSRLAFERADNDVIHRYHLSYVDRREAGVDVWCWWGIRHPLVESIFHKTSGFDKRFHLGTISVGFEHRPTEGGEPYYWRLAALEDVPSTASALLEVFNQQALPFFFDYASLPAMHGLLNSSPDQPCPYQGYEPLRCHHGLIVAHLTHASDYQHILEVYRRKMRGLASGFHLPQFELLARDLSTAVPGAA
jgi:hypothetical protein